jgi:hypothetical protein
MSTTNRRRATRHVTCVPAGVQTPEKERIGLLRDASTEGALLFSKSKFNVGDAVKLSIRVDLEEKSNVEVKGRIVRVERLRDGFWNFKTGVVFDPPREDLFELFQRLAERQERLFGSTPS